MKTSFGILSLVAAFSLGFCPTGMAATYHLTGDFSAEQNPNGVWSYGWSISRGTDFYVTTERNTCGALIGWNAPFLPSGNSVSPAYAATDWITEDEWIPAGTLSCHPGSLGENSVIRWTAPASGTYKIEGCFWGNNYLCPTSSDVAILYGTREIFSGTINNFWIPLSYSLTAWVNAGETIDFTVGWGDNGNCFGDATGINAVITEIGTEPPPTSSVTASPNVLWPANHKLAQVNLSVAGSDNVRIKRIVSVISSDPDDGLGDGNTAEDISLTASRSILFLRAECSAKGSGRIYTITVECQDDTGKISTGTATVSVPRGQGKK